VKDIFAGNQVIHEMSDRYGWKEGSAEKTVLHGALGALTGKMSGGNVLSGAVSESVNEFALGYKEKTKGEYSGCSQKSLSSSSSPWESSCSPIGTCSPFLRSGMDSPLPYLD